MKRTFIFSLLALTTACGMIKVEETRSETFALSGPAKLHLKTFNGEVAIRKASGNEVLATATLIGEGVSEESAREALGKIDLTMSASGDQLHITAERNALFFQQEAHVPLELAVPACATLEVHTSNGQVEVHVPCDELSVTTSNGAVYLTEPAPSARVETSNGLIQVRGGTGQLDLTTSNGVIDVEAEQALVQAKTSNGSMRFSGSLAQGKSALRTSNGRVEAELPNPSAFQLKALTTGGKVTSQFPVQRTGGEGQTQLIGSVGDAPQFELELTTSNADIALRAR